VLDLVISLREQQVFEVRTLKGNHEEAMMRFLSDPQLGPIWMQFGGAETLQSYGVPVPDPAAGAEAWEATRRALWAAVPSRHIDFLSSLELLIVLGDYAFVHAGIKPKAPLHQQQERDLLWIRNEFLSSSAWHSKIIVHGHSPAEEPEVLPRRLGIDTGAYLSGILTAVRLLDDTRRLIQVGSGESPGDRR
jgi:serine/threonine protein phosphatase 1